MLVLFFVAFQGLLPNDFSRAERLEGSNPCRAAALYSAMVRADSKFTPDAVDRLLAMRGPCPLDEMIGLLDLPDGGHGLHARRRIWDAVAPRLAAIGKGYPSYNTEAGPATRVRQRSDLQGWVRARVRAKDRP